MITGFEDSALVLAPNQKTENNSLSNNMLLMSNDILKLNLNAELVILNACSTGLSNARNAPGLTGLAQSFLQLAQNLSWSVTGKLTRMLQRLLQKNVWYP